MSVDRTTWTQDGSWSARLQFPADDRSTAIALSANGTWVNTPADDAGSWLRPLVRTRPADPSQPLGLIVNRLAPTAVRFEARGSDHWGRWSDPTRLDVELPVRPAPPRPLLRVSLERHSPDPVGTAAMSAGDVGLTALVPAAGANGSEPIVAVWASIGSEPIDWASIVSSSTAVRLALHGDRWEGSVPAPATEPGGHVDVTAKARGIRLVGHALAGERGTWASGLPMPGRWSSSCAASGSCSRRRAGLTGTPRSTSRTGRRIRSPPV